MDDFKKKILDTGLGQKATVTTEEITGEVASVGNAMLREIGKAINAMPDTSNYIGSCALHIYKNDGKMEFLHFQTQTSPMQQVPEVIADKAFTRLKGDLMSFYGRNRPTKRSGF